MRVAIYIRVSTLDQAEEGYSLEAQESTLRQWCRDHGHEIVNLYADRGISAKDMVHRPQVLQLMSDAAAHRFDIVLVWALSRFTRSVADLYRSLEQLTSYNVSFVSYTEAFDTGTAVGKAMMGMCGVFAQLERELTSERIKAATQIRAHQGKRTCNEVLGYDLDGKDSYTVNKAEAIRIRYIYDKYLEHKSLTAVAELCRIQGYTGKRGRAMTAESVRKVLTRPIYAGYNSYHGQVYKGNYIPIITVQQYNRVQTALSSAGKFKVYPKLRTT